MKFFNYFLVWLPVPVSVVVLVSLGVLNTDFGDFAWLFASLLNVFSIYWAVERTTSMRTDDKTFMDRRAEVIQRQVFCGKTPEQAHDFLKQKQPELGGKSVNDLLRQGKMNQVKKFLWK